MFKFQAKQEKALFRVGQKVTCDYYKNRVFKVTRKDRDYNGTVLYTLKDTVATPTTDLFVGGLRQKYLNKA